MASCSDRIDCPQVLQERPRGLGRVLRAMLGQLADWRERCEQRKTLAAMNERMLKDVGISRSDAMRESSKPFWRA